MSTVLDAPTVLGLHAGLPAEDYHAAPGASQSRLKVLRDASPAHLKHQLDNPQPQTDAQRLGAAIHDFVLLPDRAAALWTAAGQCEATTGKGTRCTRGGAVRIFGEWFCGQHAGADADPDDVAVLSASDYATCEAVRDAIGRHRRARQLLVGDAEQSAWWADAGWDGRDALGVVCKGRFDLLGHRTGTIVDLKTTRSAHRERFSKAIWDWGYHIQAAHYINGARALGLDFSRFAFIAVEKEPPYGIGVFELTEAALYDGGRELRPLLERYAECERTDTWPGYDEDVVLVDLPTWAPRKIDERTGDL